MNLRVVIAHGAEEAIDPCGGCHHGGGSSDRTLLRARASAGDNGPRVGRLRHPRLAAKQKRQEDLHHPGKTVGERREYPGGGEERMDFLC